MRTPTLILTLATITCASTLSLAQTPDSFFPTHVGNLWQYYGAVSLWQDWNILQDSIANDGYRYLYIRRGNAPPSWAYRLDSAFSVFSGAGTWGDTLYRLTADSGYVWSRAGRYYSWVLRVYQGVVFGRVATVKVVRSGPFHPDSGGNSFYFTEQHLASGFGVIYHWEEPGDYAFLTGCIVDGDTFGTIVSVPVDERTIPKTSYLAQNYPNPFNPTTTISFSIPSKSFVSLKVFDALGRELAILFAEELPAGTYSQRWTAEGLASGIYFYRLQSGDFVQMRKLLLLKQRATAADRT